MLYLNYPPKGVCVVIIMLTLQMRLREIKEPAQSKQVEKQRLLVWLQPRITCTSQVGKAGDRTVHSFLVPVRSQNPQHG